MKKVLGTVGIAMSLLAACCGGGAGAGPVVEPTKPAPKSACPAPVEGQFGVVPLRNKTKQQLLLDGSDDLVTSALSATECFTLVERSQVAVLINEMKLCADDNKDKVYFDCKGSFAKQGKILGVTRFVMGDVDYFEPNVKGADLLLKIPGLGGIDAGRSYAAMTLNVRVVDVEKGEVLASELVHATFPADKAGISASGGGFDLHLGGHNKAPFGEALDGVLREGVKRLQVKLQKG